MPFPNFGFFSVKGNLFITVVTENRKQKINMVTFPGQLQVKQTVYSTITLTKIKQVYVIVNIYLYNGKIF